MVIQNASVAMNSSYKSTSLRMNAVSYTGWGGVLSNTGNTASTTPSATDSVQLSKMNKTGVTMGTELLEAMEAASISRTDSLFVTSDDGIYEGNTKVEYDSFKNLMQLMSSSDNISTRKVTPYDIFQQLLGNFKERLNKMMQTLGGSSGTNNLGINSVSPTQEWTVEEKTFDLYYESESSLYSSAGTVTTADGREINFDVSAVMSRSFCEYTNVQINYTDYTMIDPLVVCLNEGTAEVTDQKFLFDIDADGEKDNISILAETCGYLSLDKNGDGVINDGSELFGTSTGNGFGELAVFDIDKNGWIDENDEIFNKLRIWTKDSEGNDKLVALGVAGIGAIYLGNVSTDFKINAQDTNETQAAVKETGIYLTENGDARLIQHVDMAVS